MADKMRLKSNSDNYETKERILDQLKKEGYIDKVKAQLRSEVIRVLEKEKK
jgi:ribosomal protein S8